MEFHGRNGIHPYHLGSLLESEAGIDIDEEGISANTRLHYDELFQAILD